MDSKEIREERKMSYLELVKHLLDKYGIVNGDYFLYPNCKSVNPKIKRSSEGLFIHHIDECKAILLSDTENALKYPFKYQKADRLVYCNYIEHLLLHIKITLEFGFKSFIETNEMYGFGGAFNFIIPEINDFFGGHNYQREWQLKSFDLIKENFFDYIDILKSFVNAYNLANELSGHHREEISKMDVSYGFAYMDIPSKPVERIVNALYSEEERSVLKNSNFYLNIATGTMTKRRRIKK